MRDAEQFAGLELFLADRGTALLRTAVLLAGSREAGEDLLQLALERASGAGSAQCSCCGISSS